jgi:hypothetical protein
MDYCYTTKPGKGEIYHILYRCAGARAIKKKDRVRAKPPVSEGRKPCKECLDIIGAWLAEAKTQSGDWSTR